MNISKHVVRLHLLQKTYLIKLFFTFFKYKHKDMCTLNMLTDSLYPVFNYTGLGVTDTFTGSSGLMTL